MVGGRPLNESRGKRLRAASRSYSARSGDPQVQRPSTRPFSNTAAQLGHTMRLKKFIAPLPLPRWDEILRASLRLRVLAVKAAYAAFTARTQRRKADRKTVGVQYHCIHGTDDFPASVVEARRNSLTRWWARRVVSGKRHEGVRRSTSSRAISRDMQCPTDMKTGFIPVRVRRTDPITSSPSFSGVKSPRSFPG